MKTKDNKQIDSKRRQFLQGAAGAGAGTVVAATLPVTAAAAVQQPEEEKSSQGYRLTQHILDYYKSAAS